MMKFLAVLCALLMTVVPATASPLVVPEDELAEGERSRLLIICTDVRKRKLVTIEQDQFDEPGYAAPVIGPAFLHHEDAAFPSEPFETRALLHVIDLEEGDISDDPRLDYALIQELLKKQRDSATDEGQVTIQGVLGRFADQAKFYSKTVDVEVNFNRTNLENSVSMVSTVEGVPPSLGLDCIDLYAPYQGGR